MSNYSVICESWDDVESPFNLKVLATGGAAYGGAKLGNKFIKSDWLKGIKNVIIASENPMDARMKLREYCNKILVYLTTLDQRSKMRSIFINLDNQLVMHKDDPDWKQLILKGINIKLIAAPAVGGALGGLTMAHFTGAFDKDED